MQFIVSYEVIEKGKVVSEVNDTITVSDPSIATISRTLEADLEDGQTINILSALPMD